MNNNELAAYFDKIKSGDKEAFSLVYNDLKKPVYTVALRIVGSKETAEDVTQEVFLRLFVSLPESSVKNPRAWIFQVARNLSLDALRKKQAVDIEDVSTQIQDVSDKINQRLDVEAAIASLDLTERVILTLHLNAGLKFSQVAAIMGLSLSSTYRRYRKALNTLRRILDGGA